MSVISLFLFSSVILLRANIVYCYTISTTIFVSFSEFHIPVLFYSHFIATTVYPVLFPCWLLYSVCLHCTCKIHVIQVQSYRNVSPVGHTATLISKSGNIVFAIKMFCHMFMVDIVVPDLSLLNL